MIKHVIFDFDMTLVDSLKTIILGLNKMADRFRLPEVGEAQVRPLLHLDSRGLWTGLWGDYNEDWAIYFREVIVPGEKNHLKAAPGARELLGRLKKKGLGLGLATNRDRAWAALVSVGLAPFFDTAVGALDVTMIKPAPDMLLLALARLGANPAETLFIGDSLSDMTAAAGAGLRGVGLLAGAGLSGEALLAAGAWQIRPTLNDLTDLLFDSPIGIA